MPEQAFSVTPLRHDGSMAGTMDYDKLVLAAAANRGGVCTRVDLQALGLSRGAVDRRIQSGLLRPVGRGVFVVDELMQAHTPLFRALALIPAAVISHLTAAWLRGYPIDPANRLGEVHVTSPHGTSKRIEGIVVHPLRRPLYDEDVVLVGGLPVTAPARTVFDLGAMVGQARLRHVAQTLLCDGTITSGELLACFDANARRGVNGVSTLRPVLASMFADADVEQSALERALAELLLANEIDGFEPQFRPPWFDGIRGTADFGHPELRIVLEADGRSWHRRDHEMAMDRKRDRLAAAHGWATLRVTWAEVVERPAGTAADISAVVARRRQDRREQQDVA